MARWRDIDGSKIPTERGATYADVYAVSSRQGVRNSKVETKFAERSKFTTQLLAQT